MRIKTPLPLFITSASLAWAALQVDFSSSDSIRAAVKDVAFDLMTYYKGNQTGQIPGLLLDDSTSDQEGNSSLPSSLWTSAALWSAMIDYWHYTGDDTYNAVTVDGMVWQSGWPDLGHAFSPVNWSLTLSNVDQGLWAMSAMQAAEVNLPSEAEGMWLELAQAVFQQQAARFSAEESESCNGGLRFLISPVDDSDVYKDTMANAVFMNLGARLARYTGNQTYVEWTERVWIWLTGVGFVDDSFDVFDGALGSQNCSQVNKLQLSGPAGVLLQAAAYLYNQTTGPTQSTWHTRLSGLTNRTLTTFFPSPSSIISEPLCEGESSNPCTSELRLLKSITLRSLADAARLAPTTMRDTILSRALRPSAEAAVRACTGGDDSERRCPYAWDSDDVDGAAADETDRGPAEEMNVLSALMVMLLDATGNSGGGESAGTIVRVVMGRLVLVGLVAGVLL